MKGNAASKVCVVGAGPVGLAIAHTLKSRGIPFEVYERDDRPGTHSYALALHPATVKLMLDWGLADKLRQDSLSVTKFIYCDEKEPRFTLDLSQIPGEEEGLLIVGQDHLEAAMIEPLEADRVPIHWSQRLSGLDQDDESVELNLETLSEGMSGYAMARLEWQVEKERKTRSDYVLGADGHFSIIRRKLGIEFPKVASAQSFAVFEFKTDYEHNNEARVVFSDDGLGVLWPLPGGYCRWGFEIPEAEAEQFSRDKDRLYMQVGAHGYQALETDILKEMLDKRAPWFDGSIGRFRWRMIVRFEKRLATAFGRDRVWLAGDSAHITGPIGMQSMNVGILEGRELANRISDLIEGIASPATLNDYCGERRLEWRALMGLSTSLVESAGISSFIQANKDRLLFCLPASIKTLPNFVHALGLELKYH
jgi:2-polyprenyl-6-methoxyphenol hydroxylase-like FAD-dependent oxidoreductase